MNYFQVMKDKLIFMFTKRSLILLLLTFFISPNILSAKEKLSKNAKFVHYKNDVSDPTSIGSNQVFSLYQDKSGIMWAGCNFSGINKFNPGQQKFAHFKKKLDDDSGLNNNSISLEININSFFI